MPDRRSASIGRQAAAATGRSSAANVDRVLVRPGLATSVLLVSDLDGTLLRSDGTLSAATVQVVNDFIAGGGLFTYATARSFTSASRVTRGLNVALPVVTYGGAVVAEPRSGVVSAVQFLPVAATLQVLEATANSGEVQPIVFAMHQGRDRVCWVAARPNRWVETFLRDRDGDPRLMPLDDWSQIDPSAVFYISLIGDHSALAGVRARLSPRGCHSTFSEDVYTAGTWWLELTSVQGNKAAALSALKQQLGAPTMITFGDNHHDLPMFAIADHSIAVANAVPEVRAAASEVIDDNDADSVAHWIAQHFLTVNYPAV